MMGIIFAVVLVLCLIGIFYTTVEYAYFCGMSAAHDEVLEEWGRDIERLKESDEVNHEKRLILIDKDSEISTLIMDKMMKFKLSNVFKEAINGRKRSKRGDKETPV